MNYGISFLVKSQCCFYCFSFQMRIYIFLYLMCWVRSDNKKPCLEFSKLSIKDSFIDLFFPRLRIILMVYTRKNLDCAELLFENNKLNANFNTQKKTVWIIHGYRPLGSTPSWLEKLIRVLLDKEDMNVIVVDWNQGATTFLYNRAVKNTRKVAESLSETIQKLLEYGVSLDKFHFIGISLGAHIGGFVGKIFHGEVGRITGLDPAGPKFSGKPSNSKLDYTDAKFVDVIHSDGKALGILEPLGHIDFYPNGGRDQPGCPRTIFSGMNYLKCDHQRAVRLFLSALETDCKFVSFPCRSYKDFKSSLCVECGSFQKDSCPRLGYQAELWKKGLEQRMEGWPLRTVVYLDTGEKDPFCSYYFLLSIVVLDEDMNDGQMSLKLLNKLGVFEELKIYEKSKQFDKLQSVNILAHVSNDITDLSNISLTYFQNSDLHCPRCQYRIKSFVLRSLTYPERPNFCRYDFMIKEKKEEFLQPEKCTTDN